MAGQEFRTQRTTTKLLLLWKCSALLLSSQITSALTRTGFVSSFSRNRLLLSTLPATLLSFMISMAAAITSRSDVPGQEQSAPIWDMQLVFELIATFPCTPPLLIAQIYPFHLFMLKRGRSFKLKKWDIGVNDHVYLWPAVMAILDK